MSNHRVPAIVVVVGLLVILLVLSGDGNERRRASFGAPASVMAMADPVDVVSTTWYCAGGTAVPDGAANLTVVVANAGPDERTGTVTWVPTGEDVAPVDVPITVAAADVVSLKAIESVTAPVVSAIVELDGGEVAVDHVISGPRGSGIAPCASETSDEWYLANGVTERDASQVLALFNPFPDDAIVDIAVSSEEGRDERQALQGLPVPAGSTTFVNLHQQVNRQVVTATSVVARTGRLVVDRIQSFDGSLGRTGSSLTLAAPRPAEVWWFPDGLRADGLTQEWHVYNPGDAEALVSIEIVPDEGVLPEPLDLTVPARSQLTVSAAEVEQLGADVAHSSTVRSLNGVPVVVERAVASRAPATRRGWSSMVGSPLAARRWVFPLGEASGNTDEWIVVHNPGIDEITFSIVALAGGQRLPIEGQQDLTLGPAGRRAVRLGDHIRRAPLPIVVEADGAVIVERDIYGVGRVGVSNAIGIPLP